MKKHWLVEAGSSNSAKKCSKEGFAWIFSVWRENIESGGWLFERAQAGF